MPFFHDAPVFRLKDIGAFTMFCERYHIQLDMHINEQILAVARAFSSVPYENLTKIIKSDTVVGSASAMRYPDEVINDHLRWGTGGTCFSLTAAIIAVYDALGIEAQPLLADRHYGSDTHCGLVVIRKRGTPPVREELLLDPGYLLFTPVPLPTMVTEVVPQGYTTIELRPCERGRLIELFTVVKGNRKLRLVYKRAVVDAQTFTNAWLASFSWEMMTYPVATRCIAGQHIYIQDSSMAVRNAETTRRMNISPSECIGFMKTDLGIAGDITSKAWSIIHGST